ncbi:MAG: hypothetical protein IJA91_03020 [Clostridia bacterium]|nr:hypothetical protein [Clostridia bacterium]
MPHYTQYTLDEYASLLNRTFTPFFPRDNRPRAITDTTDKGAEILEFILPHPEDKRFSVSLRVNSYNAHVSTCSLRFGQAEVASTLTPEDALSAIEEIIEDRIVAVVRYKNQAAYENHRKASTSPAEWLYQMPDDESKLNRMLEKLRKPAGFPAKLSGKYIGIFEIYRWSGSQLLAR